MMLYGDLPAMEVPEKPGGNVSAVVSSQTEQSELSSDEKIGRLAVTVNGWFPTKHLAALAELDVRATELARKAALATTKTEHDTIAFDLKHLHHDRDNAYTQAAAELRKMLVGPQYADELSILTSLTSGRSCQISALREVLHVLVETVKQNDQIDESVANLEGASA
jgi:hypothetical protein